jgi:hypothetical protein
MHDFSSADVKIPGNRGIARRHYRFFTLLALSAAFTCFATSASAKDRWVEFNIGPFRVDTDDDPARARQTLANLEQLRWILGGMLENKDLQATWPFRILITDAAPAGETSFEFAHAQYICVVRPGSEPSYIEVARLLVEANTPRLPAEVDRNLPRLFQNLSARGSRVTWAKKPADADLNWARLQMFATKPEYAGRFQVFLNNLRGGALLSVAEANAFGRPSEVLEKEVAAYLASGPIPELTISARPLDPKRDFGEHSLDEALAGVFVGDAFLKTDRAKAEEAYKAAGNAGLEAIAQEGFALLAQAEKNDPEEYLEDAISHGSKSAWVFAEAAEGRNVADASVSLMKARELNPRWWAPAAKLAELTEDPRQKEQFLQEACKKNPRSAELWQELAELQTRQGKGQIAQNSWIRAEDAAATPEERKAIHEKRRSLENERLDAQENARKHEAAAAKAEDDRLREAQLARIRKAEQKADEANSDGTNEPKGEVLQWWNAGEHPVQGELVRVDCLGQSARLMLKLDGGKRLAVLAADPSKVRKEGPDAEFACGAVAPPRNVSLSYKARPDKRLGTAGDVISIRFE